MTMIVEITEIKKFNRMIFVTVKDETNNLRAIIYNDQYTFKQGDKLKITCSLFLFRSEIEIIIHSYHEIGTGNNNAKLEELKKQLQELGCFDRKPILENNYVNIGVISSMNAAGMKDFMHTLNERCCGKKIYLYPAIMQGNNAPKDVSRAIQLANTHNVCDIIVLIRGGGSKDDLECFNTKMMAMSIFKSKIPIVTGIGHQIDTSLADLASCKSYITPTAVAQNITLENINTKDKITKIIASLHKKIHTYVNAYSDFIEIKKVKLTKYSDRILAQLSEDLSFHQTASANNRNNILAHLNDKCEYIIDSKRTLDENIKGHYDQIKKILSVNERKLSNCVDVCGKQLTIYEEQIKNITRPKLISNKTKEEITTLAELKNHKSYTIQFIDGSVII
uniref:Exonuclease VII large subunit C-terminal domain-containing protein n=1 Tax=viral metagenome TaxID=1070528 RepID=A0A6C0C9K2_9ZZZZ